MNAALRAALADALGIDERETRRLSLVLSVSRHGWSHRSPGIRYFVHRDGEMVASAKQLPKARRPDLACIRECYRRFPNAAGLRVPRLLAGGEDADFLYFVEEPVAARSLRWHVASGRLDAEQAADVLERVLAALWSLSIPAEPDFVAASVAELRAAAAALFGDEPILAMVETALQRLLAEHGEAPRRTLTTRDVTAVNVLYDEDGTMWLTDFDLAAETPLFGFDHYRAFFLSAPIVPKRSAPFLSPAGQRLCELLYPVFEYQVQAPLLPPQDRARLGVYARDLFARLALPSYHAAATFRPEVAPAASAQVFWSREEEPFDETRSVRVPFDLEAGRASVHVTLPPEERVRDLRLDPIDVAGGLLRLSVFEVVVGTGKSEQRIDLLAELANWDESAAGERLVLVHLEPVAGPPALFRATSADPQLILDLHAFAPPGDRADGRRCTVRAEIEVSRQWRRREGLESTSLLAHAQTVRSALGDALDGERQTVLALRAENRRLERRSRRLAADRPAAAPAAPGLPTAWERLRPHLLRPHTLAPTVARYLVALARSATASARPAAATGAAAGGAEPPLAPALVPAGAWPSPLVTILLLIDRPEMPAGDAVRTWAAAQTSRSLEVVAWSERRALAWDIERPGAPWLAASWDDLRPTLCGRHVAVASADLLAWPATYLEMNAVALETESLAFTLNVTGLRADAEHRLEGGETPRPPAAPLARVVARPECVSADLDIDVEAALGETRAFAVVGKIIAHTGAAAGEPPAWAPRPPGPPLAAVGGRLVARRAGTRLPPALPLALHAADEVIDDEPLDDVRPTVLTVFPFLAVGGAERVALDVMRVLRERVRFVVWSIEGHDPGLGTTADRFRALTPYVYPAADAVAPELTFSFCEHLIRRFRPRTLYVANGSTWIYDALSTIKSRHPELRTVNQVYDHEQGWIGRYEPALAAALDAHIGCNERICAGYRQRGAAAAAVHLVPHGIDTADFDPGRYGEADVAELKRRFGLPAGRRVVSFLSRLHPQKRPMDFIELARQLDADDSLVFFLVGDGPLRAEVEAQIRRSGLCNVVCRRFHHPSRDLFAVSDLVVLPSSYEGMPLVVLEAQAMGKPVVTTDAGNTREMLALTGGGIVVPAIGNVGALRGAVLAALQRKIDARAVRAAVERAYGIDRVAERYRRVLLGETPGAPSGTESRSAARA